MQLIQLSIRVRPFRSGVRDRTPPGCANHGSGHCRHRGYGHQAQAWPRRPRLESEAQARSRGQLDIALIRVMRDALFRRSEAVALTWAGVSVEQDGSGRRTLGMPTKTDQEPHTAYLTRTTVVALARLWTPSHTPDMPLFGLFARQISRRIRASACAAGLMDKYSRHSAHGSAA